MLEVVLGSHKVTWSLTGKKQSFPLFIPSSGLGDWSLNWGRRLAEILVWSNNKDVLLFPHFLLLGLLSLIFRVSGFFCIFCYIYLIRTRVSISRKSMKSRLRQNILLPTNQVLHPCLPTKCGATYCLQLHKKYVKVSSLWSKCAQTFDPELATRHHFSLSNLNWYSGIILLFSKIVPSFYSQTDSNFVFLHFASKKNYVFFFFCFFFFSSLFSFFPFFFPFLFSSFPSLPTKFGSCLQAPLAGLRTLSEPGD